MKNKSLSRTAVICILSLCMCYAPVIARAVNPCNVISNADAGANTLRWCIDNVDGVGTINVNLPTVIVIHLTN
jgi:hypothetical protein